jgi:polyhydroxyalkanoate synthesis regulator phasin
MAERDRNLRELAEQAALVAVGAVALTAQRLESLTEELVDRGGLRRDEARSLVDDLAARWRGDATRVTERTAENLHGVLNQLGLVTRNEYDELELRVAQLEHRLRLLEGVPPAALPPPARD